MNAKDLLVDDGGDWETVEAVGESLPQLDVVTTLALDKERRNKMEQWRRASDTRFTANPFRSSYTHRVLNITLLLYHGCS